MQVTPRPDGLITRDQAAALCGVTPEAITNWTRGYGPKDKRRRLPVKRREHGRPLFDPVEVAVAEHATRKRARRYPAGMPMSPEEAPDASDRHPGRLSRFLRRG